MSSSFTLPDMPEGERREEKRSGDIGVEIWYGKMSYGAG
jgi:hypothetical protein